MSEIVAVAYAIIAFDLSVAINSSALLLRACYALYSVTVFVYSITNIHFMLSKHFDKHQRSRARLTVGTV